MTVAADGKGLLTLTVIPKKVKDDESDALTTALCITPSAEELDRELPKQSRKFTDAHAKAACNIQKVKDELAAAEKTEREVADERRAKKANSKVVRSSGLEPSNDRACALRATRFPLAVGRFMVPTSNGVRDSVENQIREIVLRTGHQSTSRHWHKVIGFLTECHPTRQECGWLAIWGEYSKVDLRGHFGF